MIGIPAAILLALVGAYVGISVLYFLGLALAYLVVRDRQPPAVHPRSRFAVLIPAHDEELTLAGALESWQLVAYPEEMRTVFVIADNCSDGTAGIARDHGAIVLERQDPHNRGKGQALAWAIQRVPLDDCDAVVIVDADCTVSRSFLEAMNARLAAGARVIQGFDGVANPDETMLTRLIQITNVMKNRLFVHAKSKLGITVQLMGTGMCFERGVLQAIPWRSFSIGEDLEQSVLLADAGIRTEFEPRAIVYAQEASSLGQAYSQRMRWASSRMRLFGRGVRLIGHGLRECSIDKIDAGMSLVTPNYAMLANLTVLGLAVTLIIDVPGRTVFTAGFGLLLAAEIAYFLLGVGLSGLSRKSLASLGLAPVFLAWKLVVDLLALVGLGRHPWQRTRRTGERPQAPGPPEN